MPAAARQRRLCDGARAVECPRKRELWTCVAMGGRERWSAIVEDTQRPGYRGQGTSERDSGPQERAAVRGEGERACGCCRAGRTVEGERRWSKWAGGWA